ncbi:hypothetical protein ROZALSC1DRAFT_27060 [Rozella allomycis CSF55]|uniref:Uncharacterized protein n=1 Tax=Rozella allomycis (strain CSF55) TaxID=988480 RepID=A0A075B1E2_ROZAC|nr:hypothetical protein O9G_001894 [Rozella allomycis CSF55]RKP21548.1 hypothetical protein ROZALSC1DRAFT_27060 [Rozella allomycis CSF55]|eukprot:EPZ34593.1 hypothetical protein O9G_001894 [Rozella allomycis CSF55]
MNECINHAMAIHQVTITDTDQMERISRDLQILDQEMLNTLESLREFMDKDKKACESEWLTSPLTRCVRNVVNQQKDVYEKKCDAKFNDKENNVFYDKEECLEDYIEMEIGKLEGIFETNASENDSKRSRCTNREREAVEYRSLKESTLSCSSSQSESSGDDELRLKMEELEYSNLARLEILFQDFLKRKELDGNNFLKNKKRNC